MPRRPILLAALVICGFTLALGLALRGRSLRECHFPLTAACALANLVSAAAAFARARETPAEARGWWLLGSSLGLLFVANIALGLEYRYAALLGAHDVAPVVLGVVSQFLALAGLVGMPWRSPGPRAGARNLLGSCLFVGSILLILWTLTNWEAGFRSHNLVNLALLAACGRLTLLGGVTLWLLEQNPRRIRGLLGFVLVNVLLGATYVALLQTLLVRGMVPILPLASVYSFSPLILGLAAWSRAPLEDAAAPAGTSRFWVFLPYATFALAAAALLLEYLVAGKVAAVPLIGFILLTWVLLFRQFLLLRELRMNNLSLEQRVNARTHDLEEIQATLLRTERLNTLASLGAGIAHDLNNFLGVIRSSAQLIQQDLDSACVPGERHLNRIHASSERAASLTRRLMGLARRDQTPATVLDLGEELNQLEDLLRMLLPRGIELRLEQAPGHYPVLTRRTNLEQVMVNLVSNAKDAMPEGGVVTIRLDSIPGPEGTLVQFQVEDSGPGLPAVVLEHLFEFFVTTKGEGLGTGLGLATVKALVRGDLGDVQVQSSAEGCRFVITYPRA